MYLAIPLVPNIIIITIGLMCTIHGVLGGRTSGYCSVVMTAQILNGLHKPNL